MRKKRPRPIVSTSIISRPRNNSDGGAAGGAGASAENKQKKKKHKVKAYASDGSQHQDSEGGGGSAARGASAAAADGGARGARSAASAAANDADAWRPHSVIDRQAAEAVARLLSAAETRSKGATIKSLTLAPHVVHKKPTFAVTCQTLKCESCVFYIHG